MAEENATDSTVPEGFEFRKDGTARLTLDGGQVLVLRRPKVGEYRKLRARLEDVQDAQREYAEQVAEAAQRLTRAAAAEATEEGADPVEAAKEARDKSRQLKEASEDLVLTWMHDALVMLSTSGAPPAVDELPAWFLDGRATNDFMSHWRTRPLARGV